MPVRYAKALLQKFRTFMVDKVLGVHDTAHRIALGVAIGMFIALTPTIGFQMALTVAVAALFRANKVVGVPFAWISNPATLWIYIPNYLVGCWVTREPFDPARLMHALGQAFSLSGTWAQRWDGLTVALAGVMVPLWVGSVVVGLVAGAISYFITLRAVRGFRRAYERIHGRRHPGDEIEAKASLPAIATRPQEPQDSNSQN